MDPIVTTIALTLVGVAVKYFPFLSGVSNRLIPYINLLLAMLVKATTPEPAHAGGFLSGVTMSLGWLLPFIQTIIARAVYETWGRPIAEMVIPKKEKASVASKI